MKNVKGIHHVCLKACGEAEFLRVVAFYRDTLGLSVAREWGSAPDNLGVMLDTGAGLIEIFSNAPDTLSMGAIRHIALEVSDTDAVVCAVRELGYEIIMEPTDIVIPSEVPYPARIAFCKGPLGEEIEFFECK